MKNTLRLGKENEQNVFVGESNLEVQFAVEGSETVASDATRLG